MPHKLTYRRPMSLDRRNLIKAGSAATIAASNSRNGTSAQRQATPVESGTIPLTGEAIPELTAFDAAMSEALVEWAIPGGQLAIATDDRLVYNRGFGYASVEDATVVQPDMLFRIASTTKPITAVAILKLIDSGELTLDTPVFPLLGHDLPRDAPFDPRLDSITVEHLLTHAGGWNSAVSFDPQYQPWSLLASHTLGAEVPADAETIIRFMLTQPLDFDPGTQSAYSNFGFNVLGRVIEHLSGQSYEEFTIARVLEPAGITNMVIGGTTLEERLPNEVRYYSPPGLEARPSVFPDGGFVPVGYGSFSMPAVDAHGGWVASAEDLIRFTLAIDGTKGPALLKPETVRIMETAPRPQSAAAGAGNVDEALGLGWNSVQQGDGYEWSHAGALEGSNASWLVRTPDGVTLAVLFNSLPDDYPAFFGDIIPSLQRLLVETSAWPEANLFQ